MLDANELKPLITERLKSLNLDKIILFGSYAYGIPTNDSDIDLCIVQKHIDSIIKEKSKIRKLLHDIKLPKDILLVEEDYFVSHSDENWINTALYDARHKGIVLYEKK